MNHRLPRLSSVALVWFLASGCLATAAEPARPNIVLILADDYGIPGVGCYGGKFATPQLDALAAGGVRFQNCFAMPVCAPSRAVLLSGQYPFRNGVLSNGSGSAYAPRNSPSLAVTLKQAGYATAVAGKWSQLQYFETPEEGRTWGFDEFMVWNGAADGRYWQPLYNHNGQPVGDVGDRYGPDILHEFVVDFIRRHRDGPFFVYYPTPLVHAPILSTPDSRTDKKGKELSKTEAGGKNKQEKKESLHGDFYADNVAYLDKLIGKLASELDALGVRENTLLVFIGDNGSNGGGAQTLDGREISGKKGTMLEGGSRVPLIANWPGHAPSGKVSDDLVDFSDFYVTLAELAGASLPSGVKLDGHSFAPQLLGNAGKPREWVFVEFRDQWYVRAPAWKLTGAGELFDMRDAPFIEKPVPIDGASADAQAARTRLQTVLDELNPSGGKTAQAKNPAKKTSKAAKRAKKAARQKAAATSR